MKDKKKNCSELSDTKGKNSKKFDKRKLGYLLSTLGLSVFFCTVYYCVMEISSRNTELYYFFPIVMFTYMAALAILALVYIIYNRGFSRSGITVDMLPLEWSDEKKNEFVESAAQRKQRSKWLLVFIISLAFTFIAEAIVLFVLPVIKEFVG